MTAPFEFPPQTGYLVAGIGLSDSVAMIPGQGWRAWVDGEMSPVPVIAFALSGPMVSPLVWSREKNAIVAFEGRLTPPGMPA